MFGKFKKGKKNEETNEKIPVKERREVWFITYSNKSTNSVQMKVFSGTSEHCRGFLRSQAIEAKNMLSKLENEIILRVYTTSRWTRIEVLDIGPETDKIPEKGTKKKDAQ